MGDAHAAVKVIQPGAIVDGRDPEYMTPEVDGEDAFDAMWLDTDAGPSSDGYLDRPLAPKPSQQ